MVRRAFSLICLVILSVGAYPQAFGRFGYERSIVVPGFKIDREGFVANDSLADKIRFGLPSKEWKPLSTSSGEQLVQLSAQSGTPDKIMFNLFGLGFSLLFGNGIDLKVRSFEAPYLSWTQGTVAENVATPVTSWLLLSFRDRQPPIVFGFPGAKASLTISGSAGDWSIKSAKSFRGWVRVCLPQGTTSELANTAASLGRLSKTAQINAKLWTGLPPRLLKTSIASDLHSVTATWQFDKPGAVVPPAAVLASMGGYMVQVRSPMVRLPGWTEAGPTDILKTNSLTVRLPIRRVPTGRCLSAGTQLPNPLGSVSPQDIPSVAELALESVVGERDALTKKISEDTTTEFISQANYTIEPWTRQQLPFDQSGKGIDLAAAHALLLQAVTSSSQASSESNSLLTSVAWRQDWLTWRVWTSDEATSQRAGALAALTGCFCPEPERRLTAAMFQAGLSGLRGLNIWKRRKGLADTVPKLIEPLYGVRKGLFGLIGPTEEGEAFALSLLSPIRVFSGGPVSMAKASNAYILKTDVVELKPYVLILASKYPIEARPAANIANLKVVAALGFTELHYTPTVAGKCEFRLTIPFYGELPPLAAPVPTYSESAS